MYTNFSLVKSLVPSAMLLSVMTHSPIARGAPDLTGQIPPALAEVESLSEDAFDDALAGEEAKVRQEAGRLVRGWRGYRAAAARAGATDDDLRAMDAAAQHFQADAAHPASPTAMARSANAISGLMDRFLVLYTPAVPPVVGRLDFLAREIVLDGMSRDFAAAVKHQTETQAAWELLRPLVVHQAGGQPAADAFASSMEGLNAAIGAHDSSAVVDGAKVCLDQVDLLEQVFAP